jgi:hypothetical protein
MQNEAFVDQSRRALYLKSRTEGGVGRNRSEPESVLSAVRHGIFCSVGGCFILLSHLGATEYVAPSKLGLTEPRCSTSMSPLRGWSVCSGVLSIVCRGEGDDPRIHTKQHESVLVRICVISWIVLGSPHKSAGERIKNDPGNTRKLSRVSLHAFFGCGWKSRAVPF